MSTSREWIRWKSLWGRYINTVIDFLDIIRHSTLLYWEHSLCPQVKKVDSLGPLPQNQSLCPPTFRKEGVALSVAPNWVDLYLGRGQSRISKGLFWNETEPWIMRDESITVEQENQKSMLSEREWGSLEQEEGRYGKGNMSSCLPSEECSSPRVCPWSRMRADERGQLALWAAKHPVPTVGGAWSSCISVCNGVTPMSARVHCSLFAS
jgi:hypothetical protein